MIRKISKLVVLVCLASSIVAMPVKSIIVVGSGLNKDIVLESLSFKEGQDVSDEQITENIKKIYSTVINKLFKYSYCEQ